MTHMMTRSAGPMAMEALEQIDQLAPVVASLTRAGRLEEAREYTRLLDATASAVLQEHTRNLPTAA